MAGGRAWTVNAYEKKLIALYLRAESDIINEIARLRFRGLADYHAVAALRRVRRILAELKADAWDIAPKAIDQYFYAAHPERRAMATSAAAALRAYQRAVAMTGEQTQVAGRLVRSLMASIEEAADTAGDTIEDYLVGRRSDDPYRRAGLETVAEAEARGSYRDSVRKMVRELGREGITAFVDRSGRRWRLHTYCAMVTRTTTRQAEVLSVLTADPGHDLYTIVGAGDPCGVCAAYQGRVYSKSGTDPDFPPLADAFGLVDKDGPRTLTNTWLNIHPNCRCAVVPWYAAGRSESEIKKIIEKSSPEVHPYSVDPRGQKAIDAYRRKERGRAKWLADYDQWERYRTTIPDQVPKTFQTFLRHKQAGDDKYKSWEAAYRAAGRTD